MKTLFYLVLAFVLTWLLLAFTSCKAIADMPITIGIEGRHGTYGYNTERGLEIRARVREEKSGRITPTEIANRWRP